jgi:hypothetical protein
MYHELEKSGQLHQRAVEAAEQTQDDLLDAVNNHGVDHQAAWEDVRQRYLFLPSEEDQPQLGENPDSISPDSEPETTTASPIETPSEPEASEQNTVPTSLPFSSSSK